MATTNSAATTTATTAALSPVTTPAANIPIPVATIQEAQDWSCVLLNYKIQLEHVAQDIETDRLLYHLDCELDCPIPSAYLTHAEYVCLSWPLGGIWKIRSLGEDNRFISCVAWKKTTKTRDEVHAMRDEFVATHQLHKGSVGEEGGIITLPEEVFDWKMQLGTWEGKNHWFARDSGHLETSEAQLEVAPDTHVSIQLLAGFAPIEVELALNRLTAVDTVAQTFAADVTWTVTLCGITIIREDTVLRELLDMLEFNESEFEFTNINEVISDEPVTSMVLPAGRVHFLDPLAPKRTIDKGLHHLQYRKRINATFNEEMSLFHFPFDQQKLTFSFDMSHGVLPSLTIAPAPIDPGRFAVQHFKLGNIFRVVYGEQVFVGEVVDSGITKCIRFEIMLERHSTYYITNVVIPSAVITYLCFITYAPLSDGSMMDTGSRLQVVTTLLLTDVTFKYNLATLLPQVSYFTVIDKYVYFCFIVASLVTLENALFPLIVKHLLLSDSWNEDGLLGFSFGWFTVVNVVWGLYIFYWVKIRTHQSKVLTIVNEYVRIIQRSIPAEHREAVLRGYLAKLNFKAWALPSIASTKRGSLYVQLPSDSPMEEKRCSRYEKKTGLYRKQALRDLPDIQKLYRALDPTAVTPATSPVGVAGSSAVPVHGITAVIAKETSANAAIVVNVQDDAGARKKAENSYGSFA